MQPPFLALQPWHIPAGRAAGLAAHDMQRALPAPKCPSINLMRIIASAAGDGLIVSPSSAGIFLQGLAVYNLQGEPLASPDLPPAVVADAFRYAMEHDVPLSAFLGDTCVTLKMHTELKVRTLGSQW